MTMLSLGGLFSQAADKKGEVIPYLMTGVTEYSGENPFRSQSVGLMTVVREQTSNGGNWNYTIKYKSALTSGNNQASFQFSPPPLMISCDSDRKRMVGGMEFLRDFGALSNTAMDKVGRAEYSGSRRVKVPLDLSDCLPASPVFKITYKSAVSRTLGNCLVVAAVSDMFSCKIPDSDGILTGTFRIVVVGDPTLNDLYFRFCSFTSSHNGQKMNTADQFWITDANAKPVDLTDILPIIENFGKTFPSTMEKIPECAGVPPQPWIVHAMTVRKYMDAVAGAAIEGKPNFIELATVGSILAIDATISLANKALAAGVEYTTGYKIPVWGGIPSFVGDKVGWLAASGVNAATGKETLNVKNWSTTGADLASLAMIPFSFTAPGKALDAIQLINKLPAGATVAANVILQINKGGKIIQMTELQAKIINGLDAIKTIYEAYNNQKEIWSPQPGSGQYVGGIKSSSVAGGLSFAPVSTMAIQRAEYIRSDNALLINGKYKYLIPVTPAEFDRLCRVVADRAGFGYSLAGAVPEHYAGADNIGQALNITDRFLGSIAFGDTAGIPAECVPAATYRSHPDALQQAFPYCFKINFNYRFEPGSDNLIHVVNDAEIGFIAALPEKAQQKKWELDTAAQSKAIPAGLAANGKHLADEWQYYSQTAPVLAARRFGEAAAFCVMLQKSGIKLDNFMQVSETVLPFGK